MRILKQYTALLLVIASLVGCKRDEFDPFFGEQACPDDGFSVLAGLTLNTNAPSTVNFSSGDSLYISASFSAAATWTITITGQTSNAVKTFTGRSNNISIGWYGRPGSDIWFSNELVEVELQIQCKTDLTETKSVNITTGDFTSDPQLVYLNDFDGNGVAPGSWLFYVENDATYGSGVADTAYCPGTVKTGLCNSPTSPQGGTYLSFVGTQAITAGESKNLYGSYEVYPPALTALPAEPCQVYFNFYANSAGTPAKVVVNFWHWNATDRFGSISFNLSGNEWGLQSVNLADLDKTNATVSTFNPQDIGIVFFTFVQQEAIAPTEVDIDMATFTMYSDFLGKTDSD